MHTVFEYKHQPTLPIPEQTRACLPHTKHHGCQNSRSSREKRNLHAELKPFQRLKSIRIHEELLSILYRFQLGRPTAPANCPSNGLKKNTPLIPLRRFRIVSPIRIGQQADPILLMNSLHRESRFVLGNSLKCDR